MNKKEVQDKAREIGHCLCSPVFTCPCNYFKDKNLCKCAGDKDDNDYNTWVEYNKK